MTEVYNDLDFGDVDLSNEFSSQPTGLSDDFASEESDDDIFNSFVDNDNHKSDNKDDIDDDDGITNSFVGQNTINDDFEGDDRSDDYFVGEDLNEEYNKAAAKNESQDENTEEQPSQEKKTSIMSIFDGSLFLSETVLNNIPYILFVTFLFLVSIANRNSAESIIRDNIKLRREVNELKAQSITIAANLMNISKETEVADRINKNNLGIKPQKEPPKFFVVKKFERADSLVSESEQRKFIKKINQTK